MDEEEKSTEVDNVPSKYSARSTDGKSNRRISPQNPVQVIRCTATARSTGQRCGRWSLRGSNVCAKHGGQLPTVKAHAQAVVEAARLRLLDMADQAIDVIEDLSLNATAEQVRLKASTEILDRSGIRGGTEVLVAVEDNRTETAAERTMRHLEETSKRLEDFKKAAEEKAAKSAADGSDVIDAELVEDED